MSSSAALLVMRRSSGPPPGAWPYAARAPLPPEPFITAEQPPAPQASCWFAAPVAGVLPVAYIPAKRDRRFHRGNAIGVRVPGLMEGDDDGLGGRTFDYTWYWVKYSDSQMRLACDWHALGCSYTHTSLSIPQTWNYGKTLDDLARVMRYAHSRGMYVSLNVGSDGRPFADFKPALEYLLQVGALIPGWDVLCAVWQIDKWYAPAAGIEFIKATAAWGHPRGFLIFVHWGGGYEGWSQSCAMWDDETADRWGITNRFTFQSALREDLDGHYGQCWTEAPVDQVQSWISKIVVAFPPGMSFVAAEMDMQAEANNPAQRLELYGDQKAYYAQCAMPNFGVQISSFNGSRGKNGRVILPY